MHALVGSVADELEARRNKEINIMIYGLPELGTDSASEQEEIKAVATLLDEGLHSNVQVGDIQQAFRLGRPRPAHDRPRPIKVFLGSSPKRQAVLNKAKTLATLPNDQKYKKVYIRPDWTKVQRDLDYARRHSSQPETAGSGDISSDQNHGPDFQAASARRSARHSQSGAHRSGNQ